MISMLRSYSAGVMLLALAGCGDGPCLIPPCALPQAIVVKVSSSVAGRAVDSAFVRVNGTSAGFCSGSGTSSETCSVMGGPGMYELDIGAPGFQTVHRSANVLGREAPKCGCGSVETATVTVALVPAGI